MSDIERTPPRLTKADLSVFSAQATSASRAPQKSYNFSFSLAAICDLDESRKNPSYSAKQWFEEWRHDESLNLRERNMARHLACEGVRDYLIVRTPKTVDFHFASLWECNIAKMAFLEDKKYVVTIAPPDEGMPLGQARKYLHKLSEDFKNADRGYRIKFKLDRSTRQISVTCPNRRAYVDFMGDDYAITLP
jgi:hypothetical protein